MALVWFDRYIKKQYLCVHNNIKFMLLNLHKCFFLPPFFLRVPVCIFKGIYLPESPTRYFDSIQLYGMHQFVQFIIIQISHYLYTYVVYNLK